MENRNLIGTDWRHVKRGTEYTIIGEAVLQCSTEPKLDDKPVILYMGDDGRVWARLKDEFLDGRFEELE